MKAKLLLMFLLLYSGTLFTEENIEPQLESAQSGSNGNEIKETSGF